MEVCMRLYYYTAKQWGMKSLWEKRLKIAQYADLNDPFELLPFIQTDQQARTLTRKVVQFIANGYGVLCFSESWKTTLMWAHYGDKHKGICLGFEVAENPNLTKIEYASKRLASPIELSKPNAEFNGATLSKILNVKHSGWRYEKEQRLRVPLHEKRDGTYYNPFNSGMDLREVIIGARSTLSIVDVAEAVGNQPESDVEIWTARAAHGAFNMCTNRDLPKKTIPGLDSGIKWQRQLAEALRRPVKE